MKSKFYLIVAVATAFTQLLNAQQSVQLRTTGGSFAPGQGPSVASVGPIAMYYRNANNNSFSNLSGTNDPATSASFSLTNQRFTGFNYGNISTGLVFGAQPTLATSSGSQSVAPYNIYNKLGYYTTSPGGPPSNLFKASLSINNWQGYGSGNSLPSTGIFSGAATGEPEANGAVYIFTCAQRQYDLASGYGDNDRYYYGDLVINFNRYISNPILHIAGLGGSYRYFPVGAGNINNPALWRSAYFSTELQVVGFNLSKVSGNDNLNVPAGTGSILNSATTPNGGSVDPTTNDIFNDYGAASGSVRIIGTVKTVTIQVYLRGSNSSQFGWSALASASGETVNPVTGDIWSISVSADATQLIPLASTGVTLTGAINGNDVMLNWKTLTESNTKSFDIERSTDGINYVKVGEKTAAGNSVSDVKYNHIDPNMNVPVYYYRLKMNDLDGRYSYSNVVIVRKSSIKGIKTFPNPATDHVNIEFSNAKGSYNVALFNQLGQQVYSKKVDINNTAQYVRIERGTIPAGMYHVSIRDIYTGDVQSEKVLIK